MRPIFYVLSDRAKVQAMALWPVILAKRSLKSTGLSQRLLRHEKIHHRQQIELLWIPFYLWYVLEWLYKWALYKDKNKAYQAISFEREAYEKDWDEGYLGRRRAWSFIRYL